MFQKAEPAPTYRIDYRFNAATHDEINARNLGGVVGTTVTHQNTVSTQTKRHHSAPHRPRAPLPPASLCLNRFIMQTLSAKLVVPVRLQQKGRAARSRAPARGAVYASASSYEKSFGSAIAAVGENPPVAVCALALGCVTHFCSV